MNEIKIKSPKDKKEKKNPENTEKMWEGKVSWLDAFLYKMMTQCYCFFSGNYSFDDKKRYRGEVIEIHDEASEIQDQLLHIKEALKDEVDEEIYSFAVTVVNPMLKDVGRIKYIMERHGGTPLSENTLVKYKSWLDEAKLWVRLYSKAKDKGDVLQAVVRHIIEKSINQIDRDIIVIQDYEQHRLSNLSFVDELKMTIKEQIEEEVAPFIDNLKELKLEPEQVSILEISDWRDEIDRKREKYVNHALHAIDDTLEMYLPTAIGEREHEKFYLDTLNKVIILEKEVPALLEKATKGVMSDISQRYDIVEEMQVYEELANELHSSLRVPQDLIERLDGVLCDVKKLKSLVDVADKYN